MADEEDGRVELGLELRHEIEHLRLNGRVEARGGLVEDQQGRVLGERHRDHHTLLHATRELVRVPAHHARRIRDLHPLQRLSDAFLHLFTTDAEHRERLCHLSSDAQARVQGRSGILVDHRHRPRVVLAQLAR